MLFLVSLLVYVSSQSFGSEEYNRTMFWGTYQPQLYFGMKTRSPKALKFGMAWYNVFTGELRHESDSGLRYGWEKHDGVGYGKQKIYDTKNNIEFTTEFVKDIENPDNSKKGRNNWMLRVSGKPINEMSSTVSRKYLSMLFYVSMDEFVQEDESFLKFQSKATHKGATGPIIIQGKHEDVGKFKVFVKDSKNDDKFDFYGINEQKEDVWAVKQLLNSHFTHVYRKEMRNYRPPSNRNPDEPPPRPIIKFQLNNTMIGGEKVGNVLIVGKTVTPTFSFDIVFLSENSFKKRDKKTKEYVLSEMIGKKLSTKLKDGEKKFDTKFSQVFPSIKKKYRKFAKFALSNMMGGIGYFSGDSQHEIEDETTGEKQIITQKNLIQFTGVPSRSQFPRSFLWDSGFHLEVILKWNKEIGKDILFHWYNSMYPNGWIPREQILGDEGRSRVPQEFQLQRDYIGNPPTLFLALENNLLVQKIEINEIGEIEKKHKVDDSDYEFLKNMYPLLKQNFKWYLATQMRIEYDHNKEEKMSFQWKGRTINHTLASGFDDYPFSEFPTHTERHLDLYCWIYMISRTLLKLSTLFSYKDDIEYFQTVNSNLKNNFESLHYDHVQQIYANYIGDIEKNNGTSILGFSTEIGYVSLFPIISEITKKNLGTIIKEMLDKESMYTPFGGLRSLSKKSKWYGTNENYWRGKIWININYMVLKSLKKWSEGGNEDGIGIKKGYKKIRNAVIRNMYENFEKENTIFENYDPENRGAGTGTSPFTGWSSLVILMLNEKY